MLSPTTLFSLALILARLLTGSNAASTLSEATLMDSSGGLRFSGPRPSSLSTSKGVVTIISSLGTSSMFAAASNDKITSSSTVLALGDDDGDGEKAIVLICRLSGSSPGEQNAVSTASLISQALVLDGITLGDVGAGLGRNTRHAKTLTAIFHARLLGVAGESSDPSSSQRQTLVLAVNTNGDYSIDIDLEAVLLGELQDLFDAAFAETGGTAGLSLDDLYDVKVVSVTNRAEAKEALYMAQLAAADASPLATTLSTALEEVVERIKQAGLSAVAPSEPHIAVASVAVGNAHAKQLKNARAKIAAWRARAARGLWTDGFGAEAETARRRILASFDSETLAAAGLPMVAPYRLELRNQLTSFIDAAIADVFSLQVLNLEQKTLKQFRAQLLKRLDVTPPEDIPSENAAAIRAVLFSYEDIINELEVPSLSLTKAKPSVDMESKLAEVVMTFDDSPEAKIKRTKKVNQVTSKERKPGQRSMDFGLDLVAMLRPDGYGSLQGFAGYQLGGSQLIFGIHNDADDPATIAQFGGVRPPLLRIQPKLRVDVEM